MLKAILFDLDNTLMDFSKFKNHSLEVAIDAMISAGLQINKKEGMKVMIETMEEFGYESEDLFQQFLQKIPQAKSNKKILAYGIVAYREARQEVIRPFPKVIKTLEALKQKGIKLAIVSDAPKLKAWLRIAKMKIDKYFDIIVTLDDTGKLKPNPEPFLMATLALGVNPRDCMMVGDHPNRDMWGAKELGMKSCFAKYGCVFEIEERCWDYEIDSIEHLLPVVTDS